MADKNTILQHLKMEADRLGQALSELRISGGEHTKKDALEEITTLLKDIQQLIHAIEDAPETRKSAQSGREKIF